MSIALLNRRDFLTLLLGCLLAPTRSSAEPVARRGAFAADVGVLYQMLTFQLVGDVQETVDRVAGRYEVRLVGQGDGIANRIESTGVLREGRWRPLRGTSWFQVRGRESRLEIGYDHDRRLVDYRARGETFFRRRLRVVDDVVPMPPGVVVDDGISALLNYREGHWTPGPDGILKTHVVRRRRAPNEGPDDVAPVYRAELIPLALKLERDPATGGLTALVDLTLFSSWARPEQPARIVFDGDRRPARITGSMILGTSVTIRLS